MRKKISEQKKSKIQSTNKPGWGCHNSRARSFEKDNLIKNEKKKQSLILKRNFWSTNKKSHIKKLGSLD
jgi:hypothetical protein